MRTEGSHRSKRCHAAERDITHCDRIVPARNKLSEACALRAVHISFCLLLPASLPCLETKTVCAHLQALILTPTREIALQVAAVLRALAAESPGLVVGTLIGGLPIEDDQKLLRRCFDVTERLADLGQHRNQQARPIDRAGPRPLFGLTGSRPAGLQNC